MAADRNEIARQLEDKRLWRWLSLAAAGSMRQRGLPTASGHTKRRVCRAADQQVASSSRFGTQTPRLIVAARDGNERGSRASGFFVCPKQNQNKHANKWPGDRLGSFALMTHVMQRGHQVGSSRPLSRRRHLFWPILGAPLASVCSRSPNAAAVAAIRHRPAHSRRFARRLRQLQLEPPIRWRPQSGRSSPGGLQVAQIANSCRDCVATSLTSSARTSNFLVCHSRPWPSGGRYQAPWRASVSSIPSTCGPASKWPVALSACRLRASSA